MKNKPTIADIEAALNAVDVFDPALALGFRYRIELVSFREVLSPSRPLGFFPSLEVYWVGEADTLYTGAFGTN